jgi:hypothetical protein
MFEQVGFWNSFLKPITNKQRSVNIEPWTINDSKVDDLGLGLQIDTTIMIVL